MMRKHDRKEYNDWEEIRCDAQEMLDHGFLSRLMRWVLKHCDAAQKDILNQIRKRK